MMENIHTLNEEIARITKEIENDAPELLKYLDEMPISIASEPTLMKDIDMLRKYRNSLKALLSGYKDLS